jgi:DUF4097 and DUF4098 domain-containing protein YvlB
MIFWQTPQRKRREEYATADVITVQITGATGDIRIESTNQAHAIIELSSSDEQTLSQSKVEYDEASRTLTITTGKPTKSGLMLFHVWHDVDAHVMIPAHSDVKVNVASGDVDCHGQFGDVRINTASGDIDLEAAIVSSLHVKTASGDVTAQAGAPTFVDVASGDIELMVRQPCQVEARTLSGDIEVKIQRGFVTEVNAQTLSGDISSNIKFDGESGVGEYAQVVLNISSLSGDIDIERM